MSQLAVSDFFILCHSRSDGVTCSVLMGWPWRGGRTSQIWKKPTCWHVRHHIFGFMCQLLKRLLHLKPQLRWARQTLTMWLCYNSLSHAPSHYGAGASEPWSDQCPKWSPVLNPTYQTCLNLRNPDGINRQWNPADQKPSPTSCWRIWLDICRLPCLQISRVPL